MRGAEDDSRNLSQAFEENIRRTIEEIDMGIRSVRAARAYDPTHFDLGRWVRDSGLTNELTVQISLADQTGRVIASNLGPITKITSIADREHFISTRDSPGDDLFISRPVVGRVSGKRSVQFVRKLFDATGAFDGVIVVSLDPAFLARFYSSLHIGRGALVLAGRDGIVRAEAPEGVFDLGADLSGDQLTAAANLRGSGTVRIRRTKDRLERTFSWRKLEPYGLIVAVGLSSDDALVAFRSDVEFYVAAGCVLTLVTLLAGLALARNRRKFLQSKENLQAAVDNISQGLIVVDPGRELLVMNARAVELLELPLELSRPGTGFDAILDWQRANGEFDGPESAHVRELDRAGGLIEGTSTYRRRRRNGVILEISTKVLASRLAVRTYTNVTGQEQAAHELEVARDAAEAAARARSEFLAVMSHEIRTPLNGVIGIAGLLQETELQGAQLDYVRLIRESGDHLLQLINDILDVARLEASRVELDKVPFDPRALVQGAVDLFRPQASMKGLQLSASIDDDVTGLAAGDPGRLRQVLINLVGNAIKFTDHGSVRLGLRTEPAEGGRIRLSFSVTDTGIGIAPEAVERMFEEFAQMDSSISRRYGGSGLGLTICRRLVQLMGGHITVETQPSVGSSFRFSIPVDPVIAVRAQETGAENALEHRPGASPSLRVLLAEDNTTNQLVALRILEQLGHRADAVANGAEAIAAFNAGHYDLILMDVMMPEMDGLTATRRIRAVESEGCHIAVVGLTAGARPEDLAECLNAGMDAVATKPITKRRLQTAIAEGLSARRQPSVSVNLPVSGARILELREELGEGHLAEIFQLFAQSTREHISNLRQVAADCDYIRLAREVHAIAGAAGNVGATALAERAARLEHAAASLTEAQILAEIDAINWDFDAALTALDSAIEPHMQDAHSTNSGSADPECDPAYRPG